MFESIKARYDRDWIRDDQLERYVQLGVITRKQANLILGRDEV